MNTRELERYMTENGFVAERDTKHGTFWTDGKTRLLIGNHKGNDQHALRNDFSLVKKAIRERQGFAPSAEIGLTHRMNLRGVEITPPQQKKEESMKLQVVEATKPKGGIVAEKVERTMRRFTKEDMHRIYRQIARLSDKKLNAEEICDVLNDSGFRMNNGDSVDAKYVAGTLANMQTVAWQEQIRLWRLDDETNAKERASMRTITPNPPRPAAPIAPPPQPQQSARVLPQWVFAILTDPALTDHDKVSMILAMGNLK